MELKLHFNLRVKTEESGSNRTFMELKSESQHLHLVQLAGSNRTFMELKFLYRRLT